MYRTLILSLAVAAPALAQRAGEEPLPDPPRLAFRQPVLPAPRVNSLTTEPRYFGARVDAGIVYPRPPEEAMIDMEAVLRSYLPDEESLQRNEERLQPTLQRMQGIWRVEKGRVVTETFAPLPREAKRELADEAARLQAWLG